MIDEGSRTSGDGLPTSLAKRMLQGAGAAVGLTIFNLAIQRPPKASLWLILCIFVVVAFGGAAGGAVYYATQGWREKGSVRKTSANVLSLLAYALFVFGALLAALAWLPADA